MSALRDNAVLEDYEIDPLSMEEKLMLAHEGPVELAPWEITEIVQTALSSLSQELEVEQVDLVFDVIYEAISEALGRVRVQI